MRRKTSTAGAVSTSGGLGHIDGLGEGESIGADCRGQLEDGEMAMVSSGRRWIHGVHDYSP
jgi:hypothetical protein